MAERAILVVGGGLAGLAAALAAARRGDRVTLCEAGSFGRDKVCGEFLSHEVAEDLAALGCSGWAEALGAVPMRRALVTSPAGGRIALDLPGPPSFSLTRRALEGHLAAAARAAGAVLLERAPARDVRPAAEGLRYRAGPHEGVADAVIYAFGKRSSLDAALDLPRARRPERFAAAKVYLPHPPGVLEADVELHLVRGGYVGLNPVEGGRVGLCALLSPPLSIAWDALLARFAENPALADRLARLGAPLGPARGLAAFGFGAQRLSCVDPAHGRAALFAGDAARMMPSFSGDGMAVALRSGRIAAAAAAAASPAAAYERAYRAEFARRLRFAGLLHHAFLRQPLFDRLAPLVSMSPRIAQRLFAWTRGAPAAAGRVV